MKNLALSLLLSTALFSCTKADPVVDDRAETPPAGTPAPVHAPAPTPPKEDAPSAVRVPVEGLPVFGSAHALVTLVAFTDYECPYCAKADERMAALRAEYGDRLRVVIGSHPLPIHERAPAAARAFLAAVEQGKGDAMHARLFAKPGKLDEEDLRTAARDVGLDGARFDRDRAGAVTEKALRRAESLGTALSVEGTPTFFVNGRRIVGAQPIEKFRSLIDEELGKAESMVASGVAAQQVYATILAAAPEWKPTPKADEPTETVDVGIEGAPVRGSSRAPVTIVFFSDFECPFCVKAEDTLKKLEAANAGKVKVAFRHRPLPMHAHAKLAAKAAVAADRQHRFWEFHDVVIGHRDALERADLERYAAEAGLEPRQFARDLDDPGVEAKVAADEKRATELGVKGTPTAFVNGRRITGAQPLATWQGIVDGVLAKAR